MTETLCKAAAGQEWTADDLYAIARFASAKLRVRQRYRDDCVQEAVVGMLSSINRGNVDRNSNWRGYLYMVAVSRITNYLSRKVRRWNKNTVSVENDCSYYHDNTDTRLCVREVLSKLPAHYRDIVNGYIEGKTAVEIANERGKTPENIRQLFERALQKLRLYLSR